MTGTEMAFKEMDDRVEWLRAEVERLRKIESEYGPLRADWDDLTVQHVVLLDWAKKAYQLFDNLGALSVADTLDVVQMRRSAPDEVKS